MKKFLTVLILLINVVSPVSANNDFQWEFAGWEGGGCYPNVEFDPIVQGRVYLTSDVAGIWRSDDSGDSWTFLTKGLENLNVAALAIAPSDSGYLYAATAGGLFVSKSAGRMWSEAHDPHGMLRFRRPDSYKPIAVSPANPEHVCAGTIKGKVLCSQNSGQTWEDLDPVQKILKTEKPVVALVFTSDGQKLWIGSGDGLVSYDMGKKELRGYPGSGQFVTDMGILWDNRTIFFVNNGVVDIFYDGYRIEGSTLPKSGNEVYRIAVKTDLESSRGAEYEIFAASNRGWNGRIVWSGDKGETWRHVVADIQTDKKRNPTWSWADPNGKIASLKIDPFAQDRMFMTTWWGVFRSDDAGATWVEKIAGAPNTVGADLAVTSDAVWAATMDNGLLKSVDAGKSYQPVFPSDRYDPVKAGHVWRVITPGDGSVVATSSPWNDPVNQVIVSQDHGKTWKIVREGLPAVRPKQNTMWGQGYPRALAADPADPKRLYLGIDGDDGGGLFISEDGGLTWARSPGQPGSLRVFNGLAVDPMDSKRIFWGAGGKNGGVFLSKDQGKTWKRTLNRLSWVFDLAVTKEGRVIAVGSDSSGAAVYMSDVGGETWDRANMDNSGAGEAVAIDPLNSLRIAMSVVQWSGKAKGKIFLSKDGGINWADVTGDLPPGAGASAMAFSPDGKYLYMSRYAGSVYRLNVAGVK